jgi:hypothetical protein
VFVAYLKSGSSVDPTRATDGSVQLERLDRRAQASPAVTGTIFQDHDILDLFGVEMDGIEDPDSEHNQARGWVTPASRRGFASS